MTKQNWKIQFGKERRAISQRSKFEKIASFGGKKQMKKAVREIQSFGYKLLERVKIECGLVKGREEENERLAIVERHDIDDAAIKAAGIA
jgi:ribosomal protein S25